MYPTRFQVSRRHKDPVDSKRVCRPSRWGNDFKVDEMPGQTKEQKHFEAVQRFRSWMNSNDSKAMELKEQLFKSPRLNHTTKGFPLKIMHGAFSLPPVDLITETRLTPLLAQVPSFFDVYEIGFSGQAKVCEFKTKEKVSKMPLNIYRMGLALGVSRTWRDTLLEQLLGTREEPESFLLTTEEPIEKASIKSRLLSNLVA